MVESFYKDGRRSHLAELLKNVVECSPKYESAGVHQAPNNTLLITLKKQVIDLSRFKSLPHTTSYLYAKGQNTIFNLNMIQEDASPTDVPLQSISKSGQHKVIIRKDEKDLYIEVWNDKTSGAFKSSLKVTSSMTKVFNDEVFGRISWSKDESKICFVGEVSPVAAFKSPWENKNAEEKKETKQEEEKEEHW